MRPATRRRLLLFHTVFTTFSLLSPLLARVGAQNPGRYFIDPDGLDESATDPADKIDASIDWVFGETVTVRWEAEFERVTLRLWQGIYEGNFWSVDLMRNQTDLTRSYQWKVAPVLEEAPELAMHFQLLKADDFEKYINSRDFFVKKNTTTSTPPSTPTTSPRRTTTSGASSTNDLEETPGPSETETGDGGNARTSDTSSSSSSTTGGPDRTGAPANETPDANVDPNTAPETLKVGLGVGLGLGIPLLAIIGAGIYYLGKRHRKADLELLPPPKLPTAAMPVGWHTDKNRMLSDVGGIESEENNNVGGHLWTPRS